MNIDFSPSRRTSLGVEWELELVDLDTRQLTGLSDALLAAISPEGDGEHPKAKHELLQSCVEVITGICQTVAEARADLAGTVAELVGPAAERNGRADVQRYASDHRLDDPAGHRHRALPLADRTQPVAGPPAADLRRARALRRPGRGEGDPRSSTACSLTCRISSRCRRPRPTG